MLLAASIFGFLVVAVVGVIIYGTNSTATAGDRVRAQLLAEEGVEAVRNMRDDAFANLENGTYGLVQTDGVWSLSSTPDVTEIFTRQVVISTVDANRKDVTVTVSWPQGGITAQATASTRINDWLASIATPGLNGPTIMAYSKTTAQPFYRLWNGSVWGNESAALSVVGTINHIVVKSSKTRNETILGVQTSTGAIYMQIWNGTSWGNLTLLGSGSTETRSFDIAYERNSGRALMVFTPSTGSPDFAYRTWNGLTLSSARTITAPPTTGAINWIDIKQNPITTSDEVGLILLDANSDVYGMTWTGGAWRTMGATTAWDTTAATATKKTIAIAYEQTSGEALFAWGDAASGTHNFRTWNGTTLSATTALTIPAAAGVAEWLQLAARPNSNEIMLGSQDAGLNLNTRKWSGTAWDTATQHPEHDNEVQTITSKTFDIAWETFPGNEGRAWLMWGDDRRVATKAWSGSGWAAEDFLRRTADTAFVTLHAAPSTGVVFAGIYEDNSSNSKAIQAIETQNGATSWPNAVTTIWGGPTSVQPVYSRIDITTP